MKCPRCKKNLLQISGLWTPETPDKTYRKYVCNDCNMVYTEIVDTDSLEVVRVDEVSLRSERQSTLMEW